MTALDAYGLVALLADEPAASEVEELLRAGGAEVPVVNFAEAVDVAGRVGGIAAGAIRAALEPLLLDHTLRLVPSGAEDGWRVAELRAAHYHRTTSALSLADCFLLAHAVAAGLRLATADPPLAAAARAEGVEVVALPDSAGRRP